MIDLGQGLQMQRRGLEAFLRLLARCSGGAHMYDAPGVVASVLPVAPTHSVANPAFELALAEIPDDSELRLYRTRVDGELACVLSSLDVGSDWVPFFVATHREHRGRGLARELMRAALIEARERGIETSSLQATKLGEPVYERLGYRSICALEMWERRKNPAP